MTQAYFNRIWNKGEIQDYYGAISDYTKAIEINPQYYNNRQNLKDYYGAISDYTKAIEIKPKRKYYNR